MNPYWLHKQYMLFFDCKLHQATIILLITTVYMIDFVPDRQGRLLTDLFDPIKSHVTFLITQCGPWMLEVVWEESLGKKITMKCQPLLLEWFGMTGPIQFYFCCTNTGLAMICQSKSLDHPFFAINLLWSWIIYTYIYAYIYLFINIHMFTYIYILKLYLYIYIFICLFICIYIYVCIHIC